MHGETVTQITNQEAFIYQLKSAKTELQKSKEFQAYFDTYGQINQAISLIDNVLNTIHQV